MRRDSTLNSFEAKRIARQKYAERHIEKWYMWSFETFGKIRYKELIKTIDAFTSTNP
jgi:hypothetical protein